MPRTKGSVNRPKDVILAAKAAAEQRRAIRVAHEYGVRGRLPSVKAGLAPGELNFPQEIRYTNFKKTPKPAFSEATAEVIV